MAKGGGAEMTVKFVTDEKVAETSSKGNQEKWFDENRWYKLDQFGYEALSETLISSLLERSNIETETPFRFARYRIERINVHGRERTGCSSENFLPPQSSIVTLSHLLKKNLSGTLKETLERLTSDKRRIAYLAEATSEITGLKEFPQYLTLLFEIDALFLNDDRHLNNIAVIEHGGHYDYCPIFDNGAGLLSNTQILQMDILGCDCVVTGHYARIEEADGLYFLKKALDETKDQSYVLYSMTQNQLAHTMFPLGNMRKSHVRRLAEENNFINASKPDSQDICFVPDGDYGSFLERYTGKCYAPGAFLDLEGNVLGTHNGTIYYTIGQRKGLGITFGKPMYVKEIDAGNNTVTLAEDRDLYGDKLTAADFNWISGEAPAAEVKCQAKIRYRQQEQPAIAYPMPDGTVNVTFEHPQRAITPGQAVVLYDGDIVLGGGRIV